MAGTAGHGETPCIATFDSTWGLSTSEIGGDNDKNVVFYFELPLAAEAK
jgi:hypothetical protein